MYSYLALGDSYTIGEQVPLIHSFPYQAVQRLRADQFPFHAPEIIAQTGWTTDELNAAMEGYGFLKAYDFVTLLIGVNNQYRGRDAGEFGREFHELLMRAIQLSGENRDHVIVLSIPDWGLTPFAADRDVAKIAGEIDLYNSVCREICSREHIHFIDITTGQRKDAADLSFLAADNLHHSGKEYAKWSAKLSERIMEVLRND